MLEWIRRKTASTEELEEQLRQADAARVKGEEEVARAQGAFDDDGSDSSARALSLAREGAALAREHVERARRLLEAAREREAQAQRATLEKRADELEHALSHASLERLRAPASERHMAALLAAVEAFDECVEIEKQIQALESERVGVLTKMGMVPTPSALGSSAWPWQPDVYDRLRGSARADQTTNHYRSAYLTGLAEFLQNLGRR